MPNNEITFKVTPYKEASINIPEKEIGIATATHPARLGCKNRVKTKRTRTNPITPFFVRSAILCSIITELSTIISALIFLLILLKFSR